MIRYDFTSGTEGFVFAETSGSTSGYWQSGRLYFNGDGSWGEAYWRLEFPRGVYSVSSTSTVKIGYWSGANVFVHPGYWNWGETHRYVWAQSSPTTYTATVSEEVKAIGVGGNFHGAAYIEYLELDGFTGVPEKGAIYTSAPQLGSAGTSGIYTMGTQLVTQSTGGIYISNTRLNSG